MLVFQNHSRSFTIVQAFYFLISELQNLLKDVPLVIRIQHDSTSHNDYQIQEYYFSQDRKRKYDTLLTNNKFSDLTTVVVL